MMKYYFTLLLLFFGIALYGKFDEKLTVSGSGRTQKEAILDALKSGLEQKYGMTMTTAEKSQMFSGELDIVDNQKETTKQVSSETLNSKIQTWSKGKINGYKILSSEYDSLAREYRVKLEVRFPGRYIVGNDPDNRRRMTVGLFYADKAHFSILGRTFQSDAWIQAFTNSLNTHLTQTRKFTMLDRDFDEDVNKELARLTGPNAAQADICRLGQKLGTDYLVVGTVKLNNIASPGINPYTGQALPLPQTTFVTVHYRVLLAPTGQLKWADEVSLDITEFANSLAGGSLTESSKAAAAAVSDGLMDNILPFEITGFSPDGSVVIGEGGKSIVRGEFLSVYALGDEVKDTRTGEVIDAMEMRVGMVKVVRVSQKLSYAVIVQGDRKKMPVGSRLRRDEFAREAMMQSQPVQAAPAATTEVQTTPAGGVVVPF